MKVQSLRTRVVLLVLLAIGVVLVPLVLATYAFTMSEVDELFDARLAENAKTIDALGLGATASTSEPTIVESSLPRNEQHRVVIRGHTYESQIGFQIWDSSNHLKVVSANFKALPLDAVPAGYADTRVDGRRWRVFSYLAADNRWVRVGERYDSRREIGRALAAEACFPLLIAVPLLVFLVGAAVYRGLSPVRNLAEQLAGRPVEATEPVGLGDLPSELNPVVRSLNGLLARLGKTLEDERAFTTNAAHELRTPLAGAVIHLENAAHAADLPSAQVSLQDARIGLERLTRLVNQLLDLARWDAGQIQGMKAVDLRICVEEELADAGTALSDKNIETTWTTPDVPMLVKGWPPGLRTLIRNLLENAIRHSPPEGKIRLRVAHDQGWVVFSISDQGPGIPEHARQHVFQRFRRGPSETTGAGIGLSLVARIAELHQATIQLAAGQDGWGLQVDVRFPLLQSPGS